MRSDRRIILRLRNRPWRRSPCLPLWPTRNDLLGPLIYLSDKKTYTLALGMNGFFSRASSGVGAVDGRVHRDDFAHHPALFFAQRTFIEGDADGD